MRRRAPTFEPLVLDHLLDAATCARLISRAEASGFEVGSATPGAGPHVVDGAGRISARAVATLEDPRLALRLYQRLRERLPEHLGQDELARVDARFQIVRYRHDERTAEHVDPLRHDGDGATNSITVLVYLDEGCEGGETVFEGGPRVAPQTGRTVVFAREQVHAGAPVTGGEKHVMRCEVWYAPER